MFNFYFKILQKDQSRYFHNSFDKQTVLWQQERVFDEHRDRLKSNPHTFGDTINQYTEKEYCISGIFLFAQRLLEVPDDEEILKRLAMLCAKAYEVTESIDNTHGFIIDLDKSDIKEMDFEQVTEAIRNVD